MVEPASPSTWEAVAPPAVRNGVGRGSGSRSRRLHLRGLLVEAVHAGREGQAAHGARPMAPDDQPVAVLGPWLIALVIDAEAARRRPNVYTELSPASMLPADQQRQTAQDQEPHAST
jgi:hypothetical protein